LNSLDRRALLDCIPRLQAEWELRFGDLSQEKMKRIQALARLSFGDNEAAHNYTMQLYRARLEGGDLEQF